MDLCQIKKDFSHMVLQAPQWTLTQFVLWLDLKVAEYKVNGYMVLDEKAKTMPRWIEEDILETQMTAPRHRPCKPCGHGHRFGKRRRKWRRWLEYGPNMDQNRTCNREEHNVHPEYGPLIELSDDSSVECYEDNDTHIPQNQSPSAGSDLFRSLTSSQTDKVPHPHPSSLSHIGTDLAKTLQVNNESCSTDSVIDNVKQISISNDGQRHVHISNFPHFQSIDKSVSSVIGSDTKEQPIENSLNNSSKYQGDQGSKDNAEAMVIQETEEVDIKPDVDRLSKDVETQDGNNADSKDEDFYPCAPLSPVSSALLSYQGDGHRRTESPLELSRHPDDIPDLLDAHAKRCLNTGHAKLVWGKVVGVCASYLVHECKGQPTSTDYQWLCKAMYDRFPALGSKKGPNPWSCFNRAVSQKIRHTRYKIRQMAKTSYSDSYQ